MKWALVIPPRVTIDDRVPWGAMEVECCECGAHWSAVYAFGTDTSKLECPICRAQNSEEVEGGEGEAVPVLH